jgi:predicted enzyme related to lactoylglutathione lyase
MHMEGMTYTLVKVGGTDVGGIMATPPEAQGMPPMWGVYVTVDNVDATAKTAEKLGVKILVPPTDIPDVGRFCVIQDPQGAVISAITGVEAPK